MVKQYALNYAFNLQLQFILFVPWGSSEFDTFTHGIMHKINTMKYAPPLPALNTTHST